MCKITRAVKVYKRYTVANSSTILHQSGLTMVGHSAQRLQVTFFDSASLDEPLDLIGHDALDLRRVLLAVEFRRKRGKLLVVDLGNDRVGVVERRLDLSWAGLTTGEVVTVLCSTTHDTLVLLCCVLGGFLCFLALSAIGLLLLLFLSRCLGLVLLLLRGFLGGLLGFGLLLELLLVLLCKLRLTELLDTLIHAERVVDQLPQAHSVLGLALLAGVVVLTLYVTQLSTVLVVVWHVFVQVLECAPRVEVVPGIVELLYLLLRAVVVADLRHWLLLGETGFRHEDGSPQLVKVARLLLDILLAWRLDFGSFIDRVELTTLDRVKEDIGSTLDAFEEAVALLFALCSLLVRVMPQNLLTVGTLDLVLSRLEAVFAETKDGVVILSLLCD